MRYHPYPFHVTYTDAGGSQHAVLRSDTSFHIELDAIARYFMAELSPTMMDLTRIGMALFVVDRHVRRRRAGRRGWSREIEVKIRVLKPDFWADREVFDALQEAIEFVTGDTWEFEFEKDPTRYEWSAPLLGRGAANDVSTCVPLQRWFGLGSRLGTSDSEPTRSTNTSRHSLPSTSAAQPRG